MNIKELPRYTVCNLFSIRSPRWNGKVNRREVGLALNRITDHNEIEFTYRRKSDGQLSIPDHFYFDGNKISEIDFEQQVRKGTILVIVPFSELELLVRV